MAEILCQGGLAAPVLPLRFEPVQVVLETQVPQGHTATNSRGDTTQRATHVNDRARRLTSDLIEVAQIPLDQWVHAVKVPFPHAVAPWGCSQSLMGCSAIAARRCGS